MRGTLNSNRWVRMFVFFAYFVQLTPFWTPTALQWVLYKSLWYLVFHIVGFSYFVFEVISFVCFQYFFYSWTVLLVTFWVHTHKHISFPYIFPLDTRHWSWYSIPRLFRTQRYPDSTNTCQLYFELHSENCCVSI